MRELGSLEEIGAARWNALVATCRDATVFQRYEWCVAWWSVFGDAGTSLVLIAAWHGGALVGLAPMFRDARGGPGRARVIRFLGDEHADYQMFICRPGVRGVYASLLRSVYQRLTAGESMLLGDVPAASRFGKLVRRLCSTSRLSFVLRKRTPCPSIRRSGELPDAFAVLNKQSLRRHAASLRKVGQVTVAHTRQRAQIEPLLDQFFEQHQRRWQATTTPSLFNNDKNRQFYRQLTRAFGDHSEVVFSTVSVDSTLAACHFGFASGERFIWYKPSYEPRLARCGPGEVLLAELIRYAQDNSFRVFDFTRGNERFKARFANVVDSNLTAQFTAGKIAAARVLARFAIERARRALARWVRSRLDPRATEVG